MQKCESVAWGAVNYSLLLCDTTHDLQILPCPKLHIMCVRRGLPGRPDPEGHVRYTVGGTPFVSKFLLLLANFVLYVLPLVLWTYSTYFTLYSAHDVYSVCTLRTPRCAPKVHSEYRQSTLYSTRPMRVHSEYMAHFEVQSTQ